MFPSHSLSYLEGKEGIKSIQLLPEMVKLHFIMCLNFSMNGIISVNMYI